jgi:hypothetical protein
MVRSNFLKTGCHSLRPCRRDLDLTFQKKMLEQVLDCVA